MFTISSSGDNISYESTSFCCLGGVTLATAFFPVLLQFPLCYFLSSFLSSLFQLSTVLDSNTLRANGTFIFDHLSGLTAASFIRVSNNLFRQLLNSSFLIAFFIASCIVGQLNHRSRTVCMYVGGKIKEGGDKNLHILSPRPKRRLPRPT